MTKTDSKKYPRGSYCVAVNKEHNMCAYGWLDGNPVHLLSTADGTGTSSVLRQIGRTKQQIPAPKALPRYNMSMQAVDRVDQLMQLMSLCKRHQFKKWYRQFFLALLDMALVNADIHYHFANPSEKKKVFIATTFSMHLGLHWLKPIGKSIVFKSGQTCTTQWYHSRNMSLLTKDCYRI